MKGKGGREREGGKVREGGTEEEGRRKECDVMKFELLNLYIIDHQYKIYH